MAANTTTTTPFSLYPYTPSRALPVLFAVLIALLGLLLAYQSLLRRPRWPHFGFIASWASMVWTAGFVTRAVSAWTPATRAAPGPYIAQSVLVLLGPPLYAASESFLLGRLLAFLPFLAPLHPGRVLSTFLIISVAIETLTAAGAAMSASPASSDEGRSTGRALVDAALVLQALVEVAFMALVVVVVQRARRVGALGKKVKTLCGVLVLTSAMMLVRCVVRAAEGFQAAGCDDPLLACGYLARHEWVLWVFEVGNITLFVAVLAFFPPRMFIPADRRVYLDPRDMTTLRVGPGYSAAETRKWWVTVADPFDLAGTVGGKGSRVEPFWEKDWPVVGAAEGENGRPEQHEQEPKSEKPTAV